MELTGHHIEYLYHLIRYRIEHPECPVFFLVTHPDFFNHLNGLEIPEDLHSRGINIIHPSWQEIKELSKIPKASKRAKTEICLLNRMVRDHSIQCCYIMHVNKYQFVLGRKIAWQLPCPIRGILLNPFGASGNKEPIWFAKLRKYLQLLWMMRNKKLERIYILNDDVQADAMNRKYRNQNYFLSLPDPILNLPAKMLKDENTLGKEKPGKYRFLLFGALRTGKGIFMTIEALKLLPDNISGDIEVFFAGQINEKDRGAFNAALSDIKQVKSDITIRYFDEFVPYNSLGSIFLNSDCVLVPYIGNQASSGLLGHAALYGKPVIGPDCGLVGRLIRSYDLGTVVANLDAAKLADAMTNYYYRKTNHKVSGMQRFVQERNPNKFIQNLIST